MLLLCAFLLGFVAGLRSMLAPAIVTWSAHLRLFDVGQTFMALMGYRITALIFSILAVSEIVADKLPKMPSRKQPPSFVIRIISGGLVGATVGAAGGKPVVGMILGAVGAVAGTLGGAAARAKLATVFGRDFPAAIVEDIAAIAIALCAVLELA